MNSEVDNGKHLHDSYSPINLRHLPYLKQSFLQRVETPQPLHNYMRMRAAKDASVPNRILQDVQFGNAVVGGVGRRDRSNGCASWPFLQTVTI
jgi:hypothetical protein